MHFAAVREAKESVCYLGCPDPVFTASVSRKAPSVLAKAS